MLGKGEKLPICLFGSDVLTEPLEYLNVKVYPIPFLYFSSWNHYACTSSLKWVPPFDRSLPVFHYRESQPPRAVIPSSTLLLSFSPGSLSLIKSQKFLQVKIISYTYFTVVKFVLFPSKSTNSIPRNPSRPFDFHSLATFLYPFLVLMKDGDKTKYLNRAAFIYHLPWLF